jgi:ADP-heptose:LPS heptosyltransferase
MPDAPFAVINEKRLPWDSIRILSERLVERGYRVIVGIGVPSAEEKQRMEFHFLRDNPGAARIQLRDDDLLTYLRQIERCALYIGGDTGATHAAIHFSKPSAVLVPHEQTSVAPYGAFLPYPPALNPPGTLYTYPPEPEGTSNPATIEAITESLWRLASSHM